MKKNVIKTYQYPNSRNTFSDNQGWYVYNVPSAFHLENKGLAYCMDFAKNPTFCVYTIDKKKGEIDKRIVSFKLVKKGKSWIPKFDLV